MRAQEVRAEVLADLRIKSPVRKAAFHLHTQHSLVTGHSLHMETRTSEPKNPRKMGRGGEVKALTLLHGLTHPPTSLQLSPMSQCHLAS